MLVNPTGADYAAWLSDRRVFAVVDLWPSGRAARVELDLSGRGVGDIPEPVRPLAERLCDVAVSRFISAHPRTTVYSGTGPLWSVSAVQLADALPLALVLVELWWGNEDGGRRLLEAWGHGL